MQNLATLPTEARNPRTAHIDQLSTLEMLRVINDADATVAASVRAELPHIVRLQDGLGVLSSMVERSDLPRIA